MRLRMHTGRNQCNTNPQVRQARGGRPRSVNKRGRTERTTSQHKTATVETANSDVKLPWLARLNTTSNTSARVATSAPVKASENVRTRNEKLAYSPRVMSRTRLPDPQRGHRFTRLVSRRSNQRSPTDFIISAARAVTRPTTSASSQPFTVSPAPCPVLRLSSTTPGATPTTLRGRRALQSRETAPGIGRRDPSDVRSGRTGQC